MQTEKADSDRPALFVLSDNTTEVFNMYREFVFLDEKGTDISGFAGPYNIGDRIINENGEWVVEGLVNKIETNIFRPTFF